ncbi:MAG: methionyl-tRNA formyltransferase [Firmicutes bacterium]|nr:methionyl-tRNA formyltransferase [Bacillota bacterium]
MASGGIRQDPDPVLRKVAKPVRRVNRQVRDLLDEMLEAMRDARGVGLAAPQVGISRRVIVVDVGDGPIELINPEIVHAEGSETAVEGCLSVPGLVGDVPRYHRVTVSGMNRHGRQIWVEAEGLLARAIQHEIDHLNGILFLDRALEVREVVPAPRVVFLGTGEFALPTLEMLQSECELLAVVTQPDRPRGRGLVPGAPPVKERAAELGVEVLQPGSLRAEEFLARMRELEPDYLVVADFGRILPPSLLGVGKAVVNLHPSLLPRWRGPAPIERALMAGDAVTGVTTLHVSERVDAGDIILQKEIPIGPEEDAGSLRARLAREGAALVLATLHLLMKGEAPRVPQDEGRATYAAPLTAADEELDWSRPAGDVVNHVRALSPSPGARTRWAGRHLKVRRVRVATLAANNAPLPAAEEAAGTAAAPAAGEGGTVAPAGEAVPPAAGDGGAGGAPRPGTVVGFTPEGFVVACGAGAVEVLEVQPEGRRAMPAADFLRGYRLGLGEVLGKEGD